MEASNVIAEMRINDKPTEPEILQGTEHSLSRKCKMVTATILSPTNYFRLPNDIFNLDLCAEEIAIYAQRIRNEVAIVEGWQEQHRIVIDGFLKEHNVPQLY